jgi:type IV pilus assembly protein PilO
MVTSGMRAETQIVEDQVAGLRQKNEAARVATQRIEQFRALYQTKASEYEELKVLLPEQREITNVLKGLQDTANLSGLELQRFTPKEDSTQGFITAKPVEIEVTSNFNNLRAFYAKMAQLPRIVSISDFQLTQLPKQASNKTLKSMFMLTAYYASPEEPQPVGTPGANTPGTPATTTPSTANPVAPPVTK